MNVYILIGDPSILLWKKDEVSFLFKKSEYKYKSLGNIDGGKLITFSKVICHRLSHLRELKKETLKLQRT